MNNKTVWDIITLALNIRIRFELSNNVGVGSWGSQLT